MSEIRDKALKLLEAMVVPCEHQQKSGEHEWRKCRRCLAHKEAETAHGIELLAVLLTELQCGRPIMVDRDADLRIELRAYLDTQTITGDTIGPLRSSLFVPWDSQWNGWVRDDTAEREIPW